MKYEIRKKCFDLDGWFIEGGCESTYICDEEGGWKAWRSRGGRSLTFALSFVSLQNGGPVMVQFIGSFWGNLSLDFN